MLKKLRRFAGVSLFEMLLVMVIISVIIVAALQYYNHEQQISADQTYGLKLYTFGQAINEYVTHAQSLRGPTFVLPGPIDANGNVGTNTDPSIVTGTDANGGPTITVTGVNWLKPAEAGLYNATTSSNGVPYLDPGFSFGSGLAPLVVAGGSGDTPVMGDAAFTTTIGFVNPTDTTNSPFYINVTAGMLYTQTPASGNGGSGKSGPTLTPMPALTADAITHANQLYTSYQGAAAINYTIPSMLDASGNYTPPTTVTGSLSTIAQNGDAFLRIDGSNNMEGSITFDPISLAPSGNGAINSINSIIFFGDPNGTANIQALQALNFLVPADGSPVPGAINSLNTMAMTNNPSGPSTISNLSTLNFTTENQPALIGNLKNLNFVSGGVTVPGTAGSPYAPAQVQHVCHTCGAQSGHAGTGNCCHNVVTPAVPAIPPTAGYTTPGSQITGLNEIIFSVPPPAGSTTSTPLSFTGITVPSAQQLTLNTTSSLSYTTAILMSAAGSFCALTTVQFHDNVSSGNGSDKYCNVALTSDGNWTLEAYSTNPNETVVCGATCFQYSTRPPSG